MDFKQMFAEMPRPKGSIEDIRELKKGDEFYLVIGYVYPPFVDHCKFKVTKTAYEDKNINCMWVDVRRIEPKGGSYGTHASSVDYNCDPKGRAHHNGNFIFRQLIDAQDYRQAVQMLWEKTPGLMAQEEANGLFGADIRR